MNYKYAVDFEFQFNGLTYKIVKRQSNIVVLRNNIGEIYTITRNTLNNMLSGATKRLNPKIGDTIFINGVGLCKIKGVDGTSKVLITEYNAEFIISHGAFCNRKFTSLFEGKQLKTTDGVFYTVVRMYEIGYPYKKLVDIKLQNGKFHTCEKSLIDDGSSYKEIIDNELENKVLITYTGVSSKTNDIPTTGITKSGERFKVNKKVDGRYYEVEFENGKRKNVESSLIRGGVLSSGNVTRNYDVLLENEYISREGDPYKVVSISNDKQTVVVRRLKDNKEKEITIDYLKKYNGRRVCFERHTKPKTYGVNYRGVSKDGVGFKIIKREYKSNYATIEFDNHFIKRVSIESIRKNLVIAKDIDKHKEVEYINFMGEDWEILYKFKDNRKARIRNKIGEEREIWVYNIKNQDRFKTTIGEILYIKGVGLSEYAGHKGKTNLRMRRVKDGYEYELSPKNVAKKMASQSVIYSLYSIKIISKLDKTELFKCRCENCGMNDILTLEEMREHGEECNNGK